MPVKGACICSASSFPYRNIQSKIVNTASKLFPLSSEPYSDKMFRGLHPRTDVRLYGELTNPFIYAICPLTPRIFRDSYGARLRSDNIGLSPPPGTPPAAIALMTEVSLFPHTCHCRHRLQSGFRCLSLIARFFQKVSARLHQQLEVRVFPI